MLFNSFHYIIFFFTVTILYFLLPHKYRWGLLLCASYIFYMCWKPVFILLIVFSTAVNYFISLAIDRQKRQRAKKRYLIISLFINFGLLIVFKYSMFANIVFMQAYGAVGSFVLEIMGYSPLSASNIIEQSLAKYPFYEFDIILPMGISFYTFQAASYTIDVYRGRVKPIRHYGIFSLFITFFPQLVAGPIERSQNLLPQFYEKHCFNAKRALGGFKIILLGYFKKIVIADRVAAAVNTVFNAPYEYSGLYYVIGAILFAFQLYCDFSGYSDIAIGSAKVLGFDLMLNFNKPYLSKNIKEFWRRWHISLSSWFMDYVYIPLGGNRCGKRKQYRNLIITFLVSGLWHGANWTYVVWGGINGVYQVVGMLTADMKTAVKTRLHIEGNCVVTGISVLITFLLAAFSLIFFRANSIQDGFYIVTHLFEQFVLWKDKQYIYEVVTGMGVNLYELKMIVFSIFVLIVSEIISGKKQVFDYFEKKPYILRLCYYVLIGAIVLTTGVYYNAGEFIYFQF